jgi:hypothetical protein
MSIQAYTWVLNQPGDDLPGFARLVMLALANHCDHTTGHCWPSVDTISKEAGIKKRTTERYLAALVRNGFIDKRQRHHKSGQFRSNDYWIVFDRNPAPWRFFDRKEDENEPSATEADAVTGMVEESPSATYEADDRPPPEGGRHILLEPSELEPSESQQEASPAHLPQLPNGFDPSVRSDEQAKLQAAEEARKPKRLPVIEGSKPWDAWIRAGHSPALVGMVEVNGKRHRGWYFPTLYPQPKQSTGPPLSALMSPEDEEELKKWG